MGTTKSREQKLNLMSLLKKRKDLDGKAGILKEFCLASNSTMATAREIWNLIK